jgi:hypothetical protein
MRRNLDVTIKTIHMLKKSNYSRICDKEIQNLEELQKELEKLSKFPQEPPTLHWAIGELANAPVVMEEVTNTVKAFLMLLGEPSESLKVHVQIPQIDCFLDFIHGIYGVMLCRNLLR